MVVILSTLASFANYFFLDQDYLLLPVAAVLLMAAFSLFLSWKGKTESSFVFLIAYVNITIFFYSKLHGFGAGHYLYFFPLIVSVALLTNHTFPRKRTFIQLGICLLFLLATILLPVPALDLQLTAEKTQYLLKYNLAIAVLSSILLSFILARVIADQNEAMHKQTNDLLKTREEVRLSLKEKEILLAELHHRVKNNLAIISGLLNLQDDATDNEEAKRIIGESKTRIMSMALVHRMLYENSELKSLDLGKYSTELIRELFNSYNLTRYVDIREDCDNIILPVNKSIPLGLILNEIVTNSIKYVFRFRREKKGELFISLKQKQNQVELIVKDNGEGFPPHFNPDDENLSLGIYLIKTLCEQIDGRVGFSNDDGARIQLNFALD